MKEKPKTEAEWCAYRVSLSCKLGRNAFTGTKSKPPHAPSGLSLTEYAIFNLLHAVEELSKQVEQVRKEMKNEIQ